MRIPFCKYEGTGNDFILFDNRKKIFSRSATVLFAKLCHRRFGIGADGVILLQNNSKLDFEMIYFNSDGNESSMCGNGGRCITHFAKHLGIIKNKAIFKAMDGEHQALINQNGIISLKMKNVTEVETLNSQLQTPNYYLNTGSPHYVKFVKDVSQINIVDEGRKIRYSKRFNKEGVNVNFVEKKNDYLLVRTYERGVEDETLSCGTGVVASALCSVIKSNHKFHNKKFSLNIKTSGGNLQVKFDYSSTKNSFKNIRLIGKVKQVFKGEIEI